jgi:signal transduction histidine kinase
VDNLPKLSMASKGLSAETLSQIQALINLVRSEHDVDELPELLLGHLVDLFKPDIAGYYVKESFTSIYRKVASFPEAFWQNKHIQATFNRRSNKGGAIGKAIERKEIVFVDDPVEATSKGEYIPIDPMVGSEIIVPILSQGTFDPEEDVVVALIIFSRYVGKEFSLEEYQLLGIVGSLISTVYNHSLAKALKEQRINFLASIMDLQIVDLDILFQNFLVAVKKLIPSKFLSLWLYNELDDTLVIRAFYPSIDDGKSVGFESLDSRVLDCSKCLSGEVIHSKQPRIFTDIDRSDRFSNPVFAKEHDIGWFICIPILDIDKNPLGVLILSPYGEPEEFSEEALEAIFKYIAPIANTIRLASLLNEESLLFAFDDFFKNMLEFQDQQASWDSLAALIKKQMKCAACSIFLIETDGLLHLKGTTGLEGNPPYDIVVYKPNEGLTGSTYVNAKPLIYYRENKVHDSGTHLSKFRENIPDKSKSIIFMPILDKEDRPIGIIRCNNKEYAPSMNISRFTKEDVLHLQKISKIISNAHSRIAWLREKERDRERSLNSLHHEILAPIAGIMLHIEWMEYNFSLWKSPTDWEKDRVLLKLDDMKQHSKLIDVLVTSLGRFEEIRLKTREVSLVNLLETCRGFLINEASRLGIKIFIDPIYVTRIRCDEFQMMRVFFNLLRNAEKYSDPKERQKYIRISIQENEREYFVLSFADNGVGVLPGEEERIFQKLERGSNAFKYFPQGTGLGLAFCKSIVEKHGGQITVESLSKPTIFRLKFPKRMRVNQ